MLLVPVGGKADRLSTVQHISDDVWRKEGEVNHLLNAPFGCALARTCENCKVEIRGEVFS